MTKSRNSVIGDLNVEVVARSTEGKIHSNEVSEAPENSESPKIPDVCSNRKNSEIGNLNDGLVGDPEGRIKSNEAPELPKDSWVSEYFDSSEIMSLYSTLAVINVNSIW